MVHDLFTDENPDQALGPNCCASIVATMKAPSNIVVLLLLSTSLLTGAATAGGKVPPLRGLQVSSSSSSSSSSSQANVGQITRVRLINADTDLPIAGYDPLPAKIVLDVATLPTTNLNLEALTDTTGPIGSLQWALSDGSPPPRNEQAPIWSFCGNTGRDFYGCRKLRPGFNVTVKATPYSDGNGRGSAGSTVSIDLTIVRGQANTTTNTTTNAPSVAVTFTLMNADTDQEIGPLRNDTVIQRVNSPAINVRANIVGTNTGLTSSTSSTIVTVQSVRFELNGALARTERGAPYALFGNAGRDYFAWPSPTVGSNTVTASATYSLVTVKNGQQTTMQSGLVTAPTTVTFVVQASPPTLAPTKDVWDDQLPPQLVNLTVSRPKVDVSNGPASTILSVTASDDLSGLDRGSVSVYISKDGFSYFDGFDFKFPPSSGRHGKITTANVTVTFPASVQTGSYELKLTLYDQRQLSDVWDTNRLATLNLPSTIDVQNSNVRRKPPIVHSFRATTPTKVDVLTGPAKVSFVVDAEDVVNGLSFGSLSARNGNFGRSITTEFDLIGSGLVLRQNISLDLTFPAFTSPGNYSLTLFVFGNNLNGLELYPLNLTSLGFASNVEVMNTVFDTSPPMLLNFTADASLVVNATDGSFPIIPFAITILDEKAGLTGCSLIATYNNDSESLADSPRFWPNEPIRTPFVFNARLGFDSSSWKGVYNLSVFMKDAAGNNITITSAELIARGLPGTLTVV